MIQGGRDLSPERITISPDVISYVEGRDCDFRVCTSCGGPILLPVAVKPPKYTDVQVRAGRQMIYISMYQAPYIDVIGMDMVPSYYQE
ncbi:hypothetical protein J2129_000930 [Methanofollis sp. W23]|uniref:hypothetical protein n=1 Tax=Methanofollis sp. W23 TaxID=2817849 RepID=UPI001AEA0420|nr:hypothetical protein [Methanofollis sp. W23]MBP2145476.1 hypothetical protein [Methanofollis sp. W23]